MESDEDDDTPQPTDSDTVSKLEPNEIASYVNSLKDVAKYWFYSYFPEFSDLTDDEKIWIERLNRIGIGYFRPLIVATLATNSNSSSTERILLYKAIERFIFLSFRMAAFQSSYKSSDYNRKTRDVYIGKLTISEVTQTLIDTATNDMDYTITNFINRINKRFSSGDGFYGWRDLKYLLFEYEFEKAKETGIEKLGWTPFTKVEKDKVTIEHILPQTPTKWYWRNQFRQFTEEEIKILSGSLGNLLPLSQSVNSALQNDGFEEKKHSRNSGRRGYEDGSHSELEVSHEADWDANRILKRGLKILNFLEKRWDIHFKNEEQKIELLHIGFVNEAREEIPELVEENILLTDKEETDKVLNNTTDLQLDFWSNFVQYCNEQGRGNDIGSRKPLGENWYDVSIGRKDYYVFFSIIGKSTLRIGLYIHIVSY